MTVERPRPAPFEVCTTARLWTDPHISKQMLEMHLAEDVEPASRPRDFMDRSIEWLCQRFAIRQGTRVCDFGCGPGLYTTALAERGAAVTGVDFSQRSLDYAKNTAKAKGLQIEYLCRNYLDFSSEQKYDLITLIYCDYCALSPEQRRTLLTMFKSVLAAGGSLVFDVFSTTLFDAALEKQVDRFCSKGGFWAAEPYRVVSTTHKYPHELLLLDHYLIQQPSHTTEIYNWLQCFTLDSLQAELQHAGFHVVEHLANVAGDLYRSDAREIAVVAQVSG